MLGIDLRINGREASGDCWLMVLVVNGRWYRAVALAKA